ncbi:hypothetical protein GA0061078_0936 [Bifidobacterium bohemicum]|nr:hypothetical protein GA0061078_0936 [Bifidobacterium bohemicum]
MTDQHDDTSNQQPDIAQRLQALFTTGKQPIPGRRINRKTTKPRTQNDKFIMKRLQSHHDAAHHATTGTKTGIQYVGSKQNIPDKTQNAFEHKNGTSPDERTDARYDTDKHEGRKKAKRSRRQ